MFFSFEVPSDSSNHSRDDASVWGRVNSLICIVLFPNVPNRSCSSLLLSERASAPLGFLGNLISQNTEQAASANENFSTSTSKACTFLPFTSLKNPGKHSNRAGDQGGSVQRGLARGSTAISSQWIPGQIYSALEHFGVPQAHLTCLGFSLQTCFCDLREP